jgi:transcriptional antiterminator NusG
VHRFELHAAFLFRAGGFRGLRQKSDGIPSRANKEVCDQMAKRWYSVSVLSNFEKKIAEQILQAVEEQGLQDQIEEVMVPTEEVIEIRRGKKVTAERRFMPGYVLVRMEMSDQGYHLINSINRVTGFLGPQGRPMPMRDAEVQAILGRVAEGEDSPRTLIHFEVGEKVKVNEGPFEDFDGMIEEVDDDNQRLKVSVVIFGRETPVELEYTQVTKQS